jgi:hypothetical protein
MYMRRGGLWAKHMGGAIGNTLGEPIGNLMGTHWELKKEHVGNK